VRKITRGLDYIDQPVSGKFSAGDPRPRGCPQSAIDHPGMTAFMLVDCPTTTAGGQQLHACREFANRLMRNTITGNMLSLTNLPTVSAPVSELSGLISLEIPDRF
jgi:hypothetical protein